MTITNEALGDAAAVSADPATVQLCAQTVADGRDGFLASPGLERAWIAGWHSATDHHEHRLRALTFAEVTTPDGLDALPADTAIESGGRPALKDVTGVWRYADGSAWEPDLPARILFVPESQDMPEQAGCSYCGKVHSDLAPCETGEPACGYCGHVHSDLEPCPDSH